MSEWSLVWLVPWRLSLVMFFVLCYTIGGRSRKWIRRWVGGTLLGAGILVLSLVTRSFSWWLLALPIAYPLALSLGYGGDTFLEKLERRALYGLVFGLIALYTGFFAGSIALSAFQAVLATLSSIYFGILNPTDAVDEEALIATLSVVIVPFMV